MKEDWVEVKLGEVCNFIGGGTPSKANLSFWNGDLPWASIKDIKGDFLNETQDFITEIGQMAEKYWCEIPQHFPFVKLGAFVVMPNHVHGIIIIDKPDDGHNVETQNFASLPQNPKSPQSQPKNKFGPQSKNLASIVRGFKIGVTKNARQIHADFEWQPRFHDHIIRNNESFLKIETYIIENPFNWGKDKFYN